MSKQANFMETDANKFNPDQMRWGTANSSWWYHRNIGERSQFSHPSIMVAEQCHTTMDTSCSKKLTSESKKRKSQVNRITLSKHFDNLFLAESSSDFF